jgi:hypothetical protein
MGILIVLIIAGCSFINISEAKEPLFLWLFERIRMKDLLIFDYFKILKKIRGFHERTNKELPVMKVVT